MTRPAILVAALGIFASASLAPRVASAQQVCNALKRLQAGAVTGADAPPVVYITGSSAVKPLIAALAPVIFADTDQAKAATVVYRSQGSCAGVGTMLTGSPVFVPNNATTATYWDPGSTTTAGNGKTAKEESCLLPDPATTPIAADVGVSDVFAQTCGLAQQGLPQGFADFQGPIQAMTFAVNKSSSQSSISAEAAYLTLGFGSVAPWTRTDLVLRRNETSGTQQMIAAAVGVDAKRWTGTNKGSSDGVFNGLTGLIGQADQDAAIGILAADYSARPELKQLAYQHYGQRCGYKPDVTAGQLDKRNVREGRYAIWGPLHLLTQVDGTGLAKNARARNVIGYLTGSQAPPLGTDFIRVEVQQHVVPPCAMKVQRQSEIGAMTAFKPPQSCACAFDKEASGSTTCKACKANAECVGGESCNFGYCEKP
jgi:hypothetical protein